MVEEKKGEYAGAARQATLNMDEAGRKQKALSNADKNLYEALKSLDVANIKSAIENVITVSKKEGLGELSVKQVVNKRIPTNENANGLYPIEMVVTLSDQKTKAKNSAKYLIENGAAVTGRSITYDAKPKTGISQAVFNSGIGVSRNVLKTSKEFTTDIASFARVQKNYRLWAFLNNCEMEERGQSNSLTK